MACSSSNYVTPIYDTECIGDSLRKINDNFTNLGTGICDLLSLYDTVSFASTLANLRLSLSLSESIITDDVTSAETVYVHPYNGNALGLYNTTTNKWEVKLLPATPLSFSIASLAANTNYDIYIYHDGTNFQLEFYAWSSSVKKSTGPSRATVDGARVKASDYSRRFIGCLRTTSAGKTEVSFGRSWVNGGSHPKFFLWNAYNQVPAAFSIFDAPNWTVTGPGFGAGNNNGPFSNFGYRSVSVDGTGNRVSFITADPVQISIHQDHWHDGDWAYLTHALSLEQSDSPYCVDLHKQGQFVSENKGQITHGSNFFAPAGYNFVQSLAMSYSAGGTYRTAEPGGGGIPSYPGGRHSYGATGRISNF